VRADHNGVIAGEAPDQLPRFDDLLGIEPRRRLVEDQHLGIVNERLREANPLLVALRELAAVPRRHVVHVRALHDGGDPLFPLLWWHALDARDEIQILAHGHVRIERRRLGQVTGPALRIDRMRENVVPGHGRPPLGRRHVPGQDPHRRRLSRAVRTQKTENLSSLDLEADVVNCGHATVAFRDVLDLYHRPLQQSSAALRPSGIRYRRRDARRPRSRCLVYVTYRR
jgi:hypothetical protein